MKRRTKIIGFFVLLGLLYGSFYLPRLSQMTFVIKYGLMFCLLGYTSLMLVLHYYHKILVKYPHIFKTRLTQLRVYTLIVFSGLLVLSIYLEKNIIETDESSELNNIVYVDEYGNYIHTSYLYGIEDDVEIIEKNNYKLHLRFVTQYNRLDYDEVYDYPYPQYIADEIYNLVDITIDYDHEHRITSYINQTSNNYTINDRTINTKTYHYYSEKYKTTFSYGDEESTQHTVSYRYVEQGIEEKALSEIKHREFTGVEIDTNLTFTVSWNNQNQEQNGFTIIEKNNKYDNIYGNYSIVDDVKKLSYYPGRQHSNGSLEHTYNIDKDVLTYQYYGITGSVTNTYSKNSIVDKLFLINYRSSIVEFEDSLYSSGEDEKWYSRRNGLIIQYDEYADKFVDIEKTDFGFSAKEYYRTYGNHYDNLVHVADLTKLQREDADIMEGFWVAYNDFDYMPFQFFNPIFRDVLDE